MIVENFGMPMENEGNWKGTEIKACNRPPQDPDKSSCSGYNAYSLRAWYLLYKKHPKYEFTDGAANLYI